LSNFRSKKSDKKHEPNLEELPQDSQNSCQLLTFKDATSRESMLSEKRFSNPFMTKKAARSKRVYDVHQGEPYFKLTKFHDFAQLVQYEVN